MTFDTKILMVVKEAEARAAYEEALFKVGVAYDVAGSFNEVLHMSINDAYSGLMIDILTLVRSSKEEKLIAYDCINFYPSLRVKWDARQKKVILSPLEQSFSVDTEDSLAFFIQSRCRSFAARPLRRFNRKDTFLSVLLCSGPDCTDAGIKTFTVNVSQGGAFLHTTHGFVKGQTVWLRFCELSDSEPIKAVVCWRMEWGACRSIPGIGVMFDSLSDTQAKEIQSIARL